MRRKPLTSVDARCALLGRRKPDIIVTDIFIGDDDGFALIEAIRAQDPELPIIAISGGRAGFDVLAQAAKIGANATIEKPFSGAYLVDTIDRCLEIPRYWLSGTTEIELKGEPSTTLVEVTR